MLSQLTSAFAPTFPRSYLGSGMRQRGVARTVQARGVGPAKGVLNESIRYKARVGGVRRYFWLGARPWHPAVPVPPRGSGVAYWRLRVGVAIGSDTH